MTRIRACTKTHYRHNIALLLMSPAEFQAPAGAFFILISSGEQVIFENILIMIFLSYQAQQGNKYTYAGYF